MEQGSGEEIQGLANFFGFLYTPRILLLGVSCDSYWLRVVYVGMNFYHTSGKDLYPAFEEICAEYSVDCYEIEEGNRLNDLKMKDSEYTPDTAQYILYENMHLTLVSVTQGQSHLF